MWTLRREEEDEAREVMETEGQAASRQSNTVMYALEAKVLNTVERRCNRTEAKIEVIIEDLCEAGESGYPGTVDVQ